MSSWFNMTTIKKPLAMHVRRLRKLHNACGLSQKDTSRISGVPEYAISRFENATKLPSTLQTLLRLAHTLRLPMDALIPQEVHNEIVEEIERKRAELESGT